MAPIQKGKNSKIKAIGVEVNDRDSPPRQPSGATKAVAGSPHAGGTKDAQD